MPYLTAKEAGLNVAKTKGMDLVISCQSLPQRGKNATQYFNVVSNNFYFFFFFFLQKLFLELMKNINGRFPYGKEKLNRKLVQSNSSQTILHNSLKICFYCGLFAFLKFIKVFIGGGQEWESRK